MRTVKKTNYKPALEKSRSELLSVWKQRDSQVKMAEVCGCTPEREGIEISFFSKQHFISMPDCSFHDSDPAVHEQILLFHYLSRPFLEESAEYGDPGSWLTFKQLPSAEFYNPTYQKRGPGIVLSAFGHNPEMLLKAGETLGGEAGSYGDYSVRLDPLPKIRSMTVFYAGDDELPPEAEILFSANIHRFLPLEDTAVLAGLIAVRLAQAAANLKGG